MPLPKWALVYWVDAQNWSVVESKQVLNTEMLCDSNIIGMVEFATHGKSPRNGWETFRARVLAAGDAKSLLDEQAPLIVEKVLGVGTSSAENQYIKKEDVERVSLSLTQPNTKNNLKRKFDATLTPEEADLLLSKVEELEEELNEYKKKNARLTNLNLLLQERLLETPNTSNLPSSAIATSQQPNRIPNSTDLNARELLLEYISPEQLEMCCRKMGDYKKVTGDLLVCMFSEEELLQSSVTGQRTSKEPLNKHKLDALIGFVISNFRNTTEAAVKLRIGNKLRDMRTIHARKLNTLNHMIHHMRSNCFIE